MMVIGDVSYKDVDGNVFDYIFDRTLGLGVIGEVFSFEEF